MSEIGAKFSMDTRQMMPQGGEGHSALSVTSFPAPISNAGATSGNTDMTNHDIGAAHTTRAPPQGGEGHARYEDQIGSALSATLSQIVALQRLRLFAIKAQSQADRRLESFIAGIMGYSKTMPKDEGKKLFARAAAYRRQVELQGAVVTAQDPATDLSAAQRKRIFSRATKAKRAEKKPGDGQSVTADQGTNALAGLTDLILASAQSRTPWDAIRHNAERTMQQLAATLPVANFQQAVFGLGPLALAILIAEVGLGNTGHGLADFATKERVWKRLGLAVIDGVRQQRIANDADKAIRHGYAPRRRAEVFVVSESLFKKQWRAARDADGENPAKSGNPVAVPAGPAGPYGEVYARRRAHTLPRVAAAAHLPAKIGGRSNPEKWIPGRCHNDAQRVMIKQLVEDLWKAWRAAVRAPA